MFHEIRRRIDSLVQSLRDQPIGVQLLAIATPVAAVAAFLALGGLGSGAGGGSGRDGPALIVANTRVTGAIDRSGNDGALITVTPRPSVEPSATREPSATETLDSPANTASGAAATDTPAPVAPTSPPQVAPPSSTPLPPSATPLPPTNTPVPPSNTPIPPSNTPQPSNTPGPTNTPRPTNTPQGPDPEFDVSPSTIEPGDTITLTVEHFPPNAPLSLQICYLVQCETFSVGVSTNASGFATGSVEFPECDDEWPAGRYNVTAKARAGGEEATQGVTIDTTSCE